MLQRSQSSQPSAGPLVGDVGDLPSARRRRTRTRAIVASVGIGLLAVAAGVLAVGGLASARAFPAPTLTPMASPPPTTQPSASAGPVASATEVTTTDVLAGQNVWLVQPGGEAIGVAYLLPDAADDAEALLGGSAARALLDDGWAVATGDLGGVTWGSPGSTTSLTALRSWVESGLGELPRLYVGAGMGGTTALTSLVREPQVSVACWYAIAPITDLAALVGSQPEIGDQIAVAWGGIPSANENPLLKTVELPQSTIYRIIAPVAPQERADDATAFLAALEDSGHRVTSVTAPESATPASLADDVTAFAKGCRP